MKNINQHTFKVILASGRMVILPRNQSKVATPFMAEAMQLSTQKV
jgi:hypothetical protein